MRGIFRNNGLSLVLFGLFFFTFLFGQTLVGRQDYNNQQQEHGQPTVTYSEYLTGSHFLEATMENWESEFLQMFFFVILTVFLYQKGSAESKDPDRKEPGGDKRKSRNKKDAPWPVRKGGWILKIYEHSLSLAFLLLFLGSFFLHAVGGAGEYNDDQRVHGRPRRVTTSEYIATSRFWFESLQNWQSEFLAVGSMVVLTIFLREKGSKESKPVDAPHHETGK
jgi:uncharacterized protein DUF6766